MCRGIAIGLAVLALSTSSAFAAHRVHHHHATEAAAPPAATSPAMWTGGINSEDHATYLKSLHESGYNPKNDYVNGVMRTQ